MDRFSKIFLVAVAANCVVLGSSIVDAGMDAGRQSRTNEGRSIAVAAGVDEGVVAEAFNSEELRASAVGAAAVRPPESQSLARHFLMNGGAGGNNETTESSSDPEAPEDAGIPGAIVAVIFGIFGLLVIARRSTTR